MSVRNEIANKVSELSRENLTLRNKLEEFEKSQDKRNDEIFCEFLTVLDTFERAEQTIKERELDKDETTKKAINILGVTPLDYTPSDTTALFKDIFHDYEVLSIWARDTSLKELQRSTSANVNIVVSSSGLRLAQYFERTYHIPYVLGSPIGDFKYKIFKAIEEAISTGKSQNPLLHKEVSDEHIIIGDAIISHSLGNALYTSYKMITPLEESKRIIRTGDLASKDEEEIEQALNGARTIIGDPMYQVLTSTPITPLPHLDFSGRLYLKSMPNILKGGILDEFK